MSASQAYEPGRRTAPHAVLSPSATIASVLVNHFVDNEYPHTSSEPSDRRLWRVKCVQNFRLGGIAWTLARGSHGHVVAASGDFGTGIVRDCPFPPGALLLLAVGVIWQNQPFPWSRPGSSPVATVPVSLDAVSGTEKEVALSTSESEQLAGSTKAEWVQRSFMKDARLHWAGQHAEWSYASLWSVTLKAKSKMLSRRVDASKLMGGHPGQEVFVLFVPPTTLPQLHQSSDNIILDPRLQSSLGFSAEDRAQIIKRGMPPLDDITHIVKECLMATGMPAPRTQPDGEDPSGGQWHGSWDHQYDGLTLQTTLFVRNARVFQERDCGHGIISIAYTLPWPHEMVKKGTYTTQSKHEPALSSNWQAIVKYDFRESEARQACIWSLALSHDSRSCAWHRIVFE